MKPKFRIHYEHALEVLKSTGRPIFTSHEVKNIMDEPFYSRCKIQRQDYPLMYITKTLKLDKRVEQISHEDIQMHNKAKSVSINKWTWKE